MANGRPLGGEASGSLQAMIAYEILINGEPACVAGLDQLGVLTAILSWVHRKEMNDPETGGSYPTQEFVFSVSGLASESRQSLTWIMRKMVVGDQIEIRVVDVASVDVPYRIEEDAPEELVREAKHRYYELLKKEFEP